MPLKPRRCPHCDQVLPEYRLNVKLSPLKARIFDLVRRGGIDGIPSEDLFAITYDGNVPAGRGRPIGTQDIKTMHNHISQINELIEDSGYRIISSNRAYRLEKLGNI